MKKICKLLKLNEEQKYDYDAFVRHVKKVSLDPKVRKICFDYYKVLKDRNIELTKNDFETLRLKRDDSCLVHIYEQDIVKILFKNKQTVKVEEVFSYNFITNLSRIKKYFIPRKNFAAMYMTPNKKIFIPSKVVNIFDKSFKYEFIPGHISHELGHVDSSKKFVNNRYCIIGAQNILFDFKKSLYQKINPFSYLDGYYKKDNFYDLTNKHSDINNEYIRRGLSAFSEILNETYTGDLLYSMDFIKDSCYNTEKYYQKEMLGKVYHEDNYTTSEYNLSFDILNLIDNLSNGLTYFEYRNNTIKLEEIVNQKHFDESVRGNFIKYLKGNCFYNIAPEITNYDLIMLATGLADEKHDDFKLFDEAFEIKSNLQAFLINGVKNEILKKLKKETLSQNELEQIFDNIINIDGLLIRSTSGKNNLPSEIAFENLLNETKLYKNYYKYKFFQEKKNAEENEMLQNN